MVAGRVHTVAFLLVSLSLGIAAAQESACELADAVERQDRTAIDRLLEQNPSAVRAAQPDGTTALHWAVHHDDVALVRRLVDAGADVKARNLFEVPPISIACRNGNRELIRLLIEQGCDPATTLPGGETLLMTAARTGRPGPVQVLLDAGADVNAREPGGQTALMWAAAEGHAEVVDLLLKADADWQTPLESGFTPFLFAVREGHTRVVARLLQEGADVNMAMEPRKRNGKSPRKGTSPLIMAIENGHFELATQLLEAGADPNDERTEYAPLHTLTWVRKPNRGDGDDGVPPPIGSGTMTSLEFVGKLVEHGADINLRLRRGQSGKGRLSHRRATPFLIAADTADVAYMKRLLELGADPTIPNAEGCTPLLAAAGVGTMAPGEEAGDEPESIAAVRLMLELGADINAVDGNGETAMHGAAYKNLPGIVRFLAENGAKVEVWNRHNKYGWTPLTIAEGYRFGNFRPAAETRAALHEVMRTAGFTPPESSPPIKPIQDDRYSDRKRPDAAETGVPKKAKPDIKPE